MDRNTIYIDEKKDNGYNFDLYNTKQSRPQSFSANYNNMYETNVPYGINSIYPPAEDNYEITMKLQDQLRLERKEKNDWKEKYQHLTSEFNQIIPINSLNTDESLVPFKNYYESQFHAIHSQNIELKVEIRKAYQKIREVKLTTKKYKEKNQVLLSELQKLSGNNQVLNNEIQNLTILCNSLKDGGSKINELIPMIENVKKEKEEDSMQLKFHQRKIEETIDDLKFQVKSLTDENNLYKFKVEELNNQLRDTISQVDSTLPQRYQELEDENNELKSQINTQANTINEIETNIQQMQYILQKNTELEKLISTYKSDNETLKECLEKSSSESNNYQQVIKLNERQLEQLQDKINELQDKNISLDLSTKQMKQDTDSKESHYMNTIKSKENEIYIMNGNIETLKNENKNFSQKILDITNELHNKEKSYLTEKNELGIQIENLKKEKSDFEKLYNTEVENNHTKQLEKQMESFAKEFSTMKQSLSHEIKILSDKKNESDTLILKITNDYNQLKKIYQEKHNEVSKLHGTLNLLQTKYDNLTRDYNILLAEKQQELVSKNKEIDFHKNRLHELERKLTEYESTLSDMRYVINFTETNRPRPNSILQKMDENTMKQLLNIPLDQPVNFGNIHPNIIQQNPNINLKRPNK